MANKKRTQNKRNKRSGKKQRRRTAAKQRGGGKYSNVNPRTGRVHGMTSPAAKQSESEWRNGGPARNHGSTSFVEPRYKLSVYKIDDVGEYGKLDEITEPNELEVVSRDIIPQNIIEKYITTLALDGYIVSRYHISTNNDKTELVLANNDMHAKLSKYKDYMHGWYP